MGAALDIKFNLEEENEKMGRPHSILKFWPKVIEGGICCKCGGENVLPGNN